MHRLTSSRTPSLPYFSLCRELGAAAVDEMVRGRILELRWTPSVTPENAGPDGASHGSDTIGDGRDTNSEAGEEARYSNVGPFLLPTTPILGYAMRVVLNEWGYQAKS
jgi:hypothetical protein